MVLTLQRSVHVSPLETLPPGYRLLESLYRGVRSKVYRAQREVDGRVVLLKVAPAVGPLNRDEMVGRLLHELNVLETVTSDSVVKVLGFVDDPVAPALVLEDTDSVSLREEWDRLRPDFETTLEVAVQVLAAVKQIHAHGIIHKDLNPSNVVRNADRHSLHIIDFDLATEWNTSLPQFQPPTSLEGTLVYIAPEQTGRTNRGVDFRSDLYSVGVMLYELFSGRVPFSSDDALAVVHAHIAVTPPALHQAGVPKNVSAVVMKLLAKSPEARYQTAAGAEADLRECVSRLKNNDDSVFELGRADVSAEFHLPNKLYGRETELQQLQNAFTRAAAGTVETVLLAGPSGMGKTSLVRELFPSITKTRGYFISGKFDQLRRDVPYSALVAALNELTQQLLSESEQRLAQWRAKIQAAVDGNGQALVDAMPSVGQILGPQPALVELDPAATQLRFNTAFLNFVGVFARPEHPLVVLLDDLQWADPQSIHLIKTLLLAEETRSLLLVGAYRDNHVLPGHALHDALRALEQRGATVRTMAVTPLALPSVTQLVADATHLTAAEAQPLAQVVVRKTGGNAFFVRQFLATLHHDGLLAFDQAHGRFRFDLAKIQDAGISENVADLLAEALGQLASPTRRLIALAAAIGNRFDLETLAMAAAEPVDVVHRSLEPALRADFVMPLGALEYDRTTGAMVFRSFAFQHDRIQQAAYALLTPEEQQALHWQIGSLLLANSDAGDVEKRLFDIVGHLNRAPTHVANAPERLAVGLLNHRAAKRAHASAAYAISADFSRCATALLDWATTYDAQFDAHLMLAEALYQTGAMTEALAVLDVVRNEPTVSRADLVRAEALRVTLFVHRGAWAEAVAATRATAAIMGIPIPTAPAELEACVNQNIGDLLMQLSAQPISALLELPRMNDPETTALMGLLMNCIPAGYQTEPLLSVLLSVHLVRFSVTMGNCEASARAYATFAITLHALGKFDEAYDMANLGMAVAKRLDARPIAPSVEFLYGTFAVPWVQPLHVAIEHLRASTRIARDVGDSVHAGYSSAVALSYSLLKGDLLQPLIDDARAYRQHCLQNNDTVAAHMIERSLTLARVLIGDVRVDMPLNEHDSDASVVARLRAENNFTQLHGFYLTQVQRWLAVGRPADAVAAAEAARAFEHAVPGQVAAVFLHFYEAVALTSLNAPLGDAQRETLQKHRAQLAFWAARCPANFEAMAHLVEAECLRLEGRWQVAFDRYDDGIASAARHSLRSIQALGCELAGRFWLGRQKQDFALSYLRKARDAYGRWGAVCKVQALEQEHSAIARTAFSSTFGSTDEASSESLDVVAIAKAARALSQELDRSRLLERMMNIIFENAGAQRGALVVDQKREWVVVASKGADHAQVQLEPTPLDDATCLPVSVARYVLRTGASVVLDEPRNDPRFAHDRYLRAEQPMSLLCMPVRLKEQLVGVLVLENGLLTGAFKPASLEALSILTSQMAVSLENARLFAELGDYRDRLEDLVAARTQALTAANQKLQEAAIERERIETDLRLAQKLESVGRLAAGVAHEINTPVQFVSDSVAFARMAFDDIASLVVAYRHLKRAVDASEPLGPVTREVTELEERADLDYVMANFAPALARATEGLERITKIVRSMKEFAHPERKERSQVDLNRAVETTLTVAASEYRYVADVQTELGVLPPLTCQAGEVNQVILNLVVNAAHAVGDAVKGTDRRGTIAVRTRQVGPEIEIAVSDTGTGIPLHVRDKIFDPFFTTKEVGKGTGQGLALVRSVVDKHGGSIRFETELGRGTTFFVRLPVESNERATVEPAEPVAA